MLQNLPSRLALITAASLVQLPIAWAAEDDWKQQLNDQMLAEKQCAVEYLTNVRETELAGQASVSSRVHCADGRNFDAVRLGESTRFDVKDCEPQVC